MRTSALAATLDREDEARPWRWQNSEIGPWEFYEQHPHISPVLPTSQVLIEVYFYLILAIVHSRFYYSEPYVILPDGSHWPVSTVLLLDMMGSPWEPYTVGEANCNSDISPQICLWLLKSINVRQQVDHGHE